MAKRPPNIAVFEKEEIVLINDVIKKMGDLSARKVSDQTHELLAWKLSEKMEVLPNYTFLLTSKEPEMSDYEWAQRAWDSYNLKKSNL